MNTDAQIVNFQKLYALLGFEPYFILSSLVLLTWIFYKLFLSDVSDERHKSIRGHYRNLLHHFLIFSSLFGCYILIIQTGTQIQVITRTTPYLAMLSFIWGMVIFVKTCRLVIVQYLFLSHLKHGVPILIVNIFSLILSLALGFWGAGHVFNIQLAPLLATSAAVSVILGLAMQDTLGNLFAGISLQVDKNFDIGDWVEVRQGFILSVGQVREITWRATTLAGWSDEMIVIPNRVMANAQISNYSLTELPIVRNQMFKVPYGTDLQIAKKAILQGLDKLRNSHGKKIIRDWPEAGVIVTESTEHWITMKLYYFIDNYGEQHGIADQIIETVMHNLSKESISIASPRLDVSGLHSSDSLRNS